VRLVGLSGGRGVALAACVSAVVLSGCSAEPSDNNEAVTVSGSTLAIYAAHPAAGAGGQAAADVYDAEQLAFKQSGAKVGTFTLAWRPVSGKLTSDEARTAVSDNTAIAYLGEIVPGSSGVSLQITNELGLLQISPTDTAAYLTQKVSAGSGASSALTHSPGHWYPASSNFHQTFARVVPTTAQEAKALVARMQSQHVSSLTVDDDGSDYGVTVAAEVKAAASTAGITVSAGSSPSGAGAYFYGASVASAAEQAQAVKALDAAASADPQAKLFAPSGLYDDTFVAQLSAAAQSQLTVSSPGFTSAQLDGPGIAFVQAFQKAYGHTPAPEAIFGYEAVQALVATLKEAGSSANIRNAVVTDFRSLKRSQSAIGSYAISDGDTSITPFVMATVSGGKLVPHAQG
jgi:hypothetical protein